MNIFKAFGLLGQAVFGSRFLVQWLASERLGKSVIPLAFWYLSLIGGVITFFYAIYIEEPVFIIAQFGGIVIYSRNLFFIYRDHRATHGLMGPDRDV
ncbi:MAG: lipid A biosynthesis protein [Alphaproteobacteria bacterium]|nr:lipid A biosynthesis protein [Alphaproteobacteria bacterium]